MKIIISILLFPASFALGLLWLCYGFYRLGVDASIVQEYSFGGHVFKAFLYAAMGSGLPLAVFCAAVGIILAVVSFVFKSWSRALYSIVIAASGIYVWLYFLNVHLPELS